MSEQAAKRWRCEHGHVMGLVMRNGSGVRQLWLLRFAVSIDMELIDGDDGLPGSMEEVEVMAVVEGYAADVRCSICGSVRTWVPGAEALNRMMEKNRR